MKPENHPQAIMAGIECPMRNRYCDSFTAIMVTAHNLDKRYVNEAGIRSKLKMAET